MQKAASTVIKLSGLGKQLHQHCIRRYIALNVLLLTLHRCLLLSLPLSSSFFILQQFDDGVDQLCGLIAPV